MRHVIPSFPALALGIALTIPALSLQAHEAGKQRQPSDPCAAVQSSSSVSSTGGTGSQRTVTVVTRNNPDGTTSRECRVVECTAASTAGPSSSVTTGPTSSVTTGPGGLSGSTSVPGGSSVTVQSGGGKSSSSVATASSSGGSGGTSASAGTGQGEDCVITVYPDTKDQKSTQQKR